MEALVGSSMANLKAQAESWSSAAFVLDLCLFGALFFEACLIGFLVTSRILIAVSYLQP